jgi:glycosyltransferase involved in cell wall biosynthesis
MSHAGRPQAAHNIHDIHSESLESSRPEAAAMEASFTRSSDQKLQIFYAGRMAPEKAPFDWLKVLSRLKSMGVAFEATWAGDGPLRDRFVRMCEEEALAEQLSAPGFISDRATVGRLYRNADLFLFTHITPESPRCLLEALRFGVPIVGYDSAFAADLITGNGGGRLVSRSDWAGLADAVAGIAKDSDLLVHLKLAAFEDGKRFTSQAVFAERSRLIKEYLP